MKIDFKNMKVDDVQRVHEIEKASFTTPWSKQSIIKEITENKLSRYKILTVDDNIIGYYGLWIVHDEAHVMNIAIDPDYRSQGYGTMLFENLIETAIKEGVKRVTLEVRRSNEHAINLYEKFGFEASAIRKGYYRDVGEDALIMWLVIEDME